MIIEQSEIGRLKTVYIEKQLLLDQLIRTKFPYREDWHSVMVESRGEVEVYTNGSKTSKIAIRQACKVMECMYVDSQAALKALSSHDTKCTSKDTYLIKGRIFRV